ncbi:hypothetical protein M9H77_07450 [Catharanthus roseus]|uniref:Uncharacterized protein n=1 Tax=Catharanthus roseus TaxID=4058 RepID=A0ACC0BV53_CATRO|nr:hypothetical protein M9H77_07450 [Catharanthus roseus]
MEMKKESSCRKLVGDLLNVLDASSVLNLKTNLNGHSVSHAFDTVKDMPNTPYDDYGLGSLKVWVEIYWAKMPGRAGPTWPAHGCPNFRRQPPLSVPSSLHLSSLPPPPLLPTSMTSPSPTQRVDVTA